MSLISRAAQWFLDLPPADTRDVVVERDLEIPMPDGTILLADHLTPRQGGKLPTILVRSPYGRSNAFGFLFGRLFAERGFQALVQSCRGTFGSGGQLDPFRNERADGLATLGWLKAQPWFSGEFATVGPSYLGFVQWAIASEAGPELKALALQVTASDFRGQTYAGEAFSLSTVLSWVYLIHKQEQSPLALFTSKRFLKPIFKHLPLREVAKRAVGQPVRFVDDWLEHHAPGDAWWKEVDFSGAVPAVTAPVSLLGGWYDLLLPWQLKDYAALKRAGREPYLTIGPWAHSDPKAMAAGLRDSLGWFKAHLLGDKRQLREAPVRVFVMGAGEWRDFAEWPPPSQPQRWHLHPGRGLSPELPAASEPDRYRYEPADPTPEVGGALLTSDGGARDNRALEARPDVLSYTSAVLDRDVEVIGPVRAELFVRSSLEHTDFFARLCDVHPSGRSENICDGLVRLGPGRIAPQPDGSLRVELELWPTACRFRRGHRLRLQVSSGAHPRYARNPGSGEPLGTATTLLPAEQTVFHDPAHPSAVILPITG